MAAAETLFGLKMTISRTTHARWLLASVSLVGSFTLLDVGLRLGAAVKNRSRPPYSIADHSAGWVSAPNRRIVFTHHRYGPITYSTNGNGFRTYGSVETAKTKILVVGDSFTQAYQVSDGHAYFDVLRTAREDVEVFAYGAGGYGTLQEVMVLERFAPLVRPDIVVIQLHPNDIINNDFALESKSREHNNHMRRPYLEEGVVVLRHPDGAAGALAERSHLVRRLLVLRDSLSKRSLGTVEDRLTPDDPDLARSLATTANLLERALRAGGGASVVVLPVPEGVYPYEDVLLRELCSEVAWRCIENLEERFQEATDRGLAIDGGSDPHWNATGHQVAGAALLDFLVAEGLLAPAAIPAIG